MTVIFTVAAEVPPVLVAVITYSAAGLSAVGVPEIVQSAPTLKPAGRAGAEAHDTIAPPVFAATQAMIALSLT